MMLPNMIVHLLAMKVVYSNISNQFLNRERRCDRHYGLC